MAWYWAAAVVQMFVSSVVCTQLRWSPWADLNLNMAWPNIYITSASTETTIYSECKYLLTRVRSELWSNYRVSVSNHNNYGIIWNVISKYAYSISFWILHSVEFWFRYVCVCLCVFWWYEQDRIFGSIFVVVVVGGGKWSELARIAVQST